MIICPVWMGQMTFAVMLDMTRLQSGFPKTRCKEVMETTGIFSGLPRMARAPFLRPLGQTFCLLRIPRWPR